MLLPMTRAVMVCEMQIILRSIVGMNGQCGDSETNTKVYGRHYSSVDYDE